MNRSPYPYPAEAKPKRPFPANESEPASRAAFAARPRCFVLTNYLRRSYHPVMPVSNHDVAAVQRCYPQIYLACHTRHHRRRSHAAALTSQESSILAHLSEREPMRAAALARHLGVVPSTMSAAIKRLSSLGYIARGKDADDRRAASLRLSRLGARAMQAGSVLETKRVAGMLAHLSSAERARAIEGLELLAKAARLVPADAWRDR